MKEIWANFADKFELVVSFVDGAGKVTQFVRLSSEREMSQLEYSMWMPLVLIILELGKRTTPSKMLIDIFSWLRDSEICWRWIVIVAVILSISS